MLGQWVGKRAPVGKDSSFECLEGVDGMGEGREQHQNVLANLGRAMETSAWRQIRNLKGQFGEIW